MILPDTPYQEIFRVMNDEEGKVNFALEKEKDRFLKTLSRRILAGGTMLYTHHAYYRVPGSKNCYLLWYHIKDVDIKTQL